MVSIAPRLFLKAGETGTGTTIELPKGRWRQEFDGQTFESGSCRLHEILRTLPVALLSKIN